PRRGRVLDWRGDARADAARGLCSVGVEDGDLPIHARVFHPHRTLNERSDVEAIEAGPVRRLDRELEPRDLPRSHVVARLRRHAIEARPSRLRRTHLAVAT